MRVPRGAVTVLATELLEVPEVQAHAGQERGVEAAGLLGEMVEPAHVESVQETEAKVAEQEGFAQRWVDRLKP